MRWICHAGPLVFFLFYLPPLLFLFFFFCLKPACHVWKHTVFFGAFTLLPPIKLLTPTLPWFTFDRLQPCLTLTHSQPRSRLFNCLVLSLVHIHSRCSSSLSSSPLHRRSFSPRVGCGGASVCRDSARRGGGPSRVCLLSPRCKLTQKKTLSRSVGCLPGFLFRPRAPSLFRAVTRGV